MICANCGTALTGNYVRAGKNGTKFCGRKCAYEGLSHFGKDYVDKSIQFISPRMYPFNPPAG